MKIPATLATEISQKGEFIIITQAQNNQINQIKLNQDQAERTAREIFRILIEDETQTNACTPVQTIATPSQQTQHPSNVPSIADV